MAVYHLTVKTGAASAIAHSDYIEREGKYAKLSERNQEQVTRGHGNMPEWAERPKEFWKAAEQYERANGSRYREMEFALPIELSAEQRKELVHEFVKEQIGEKHAYEWAIHDNGINPHCHLMFSERTRDGIEREKEQYFKRANGKNPERGGCRKSTEWVGEKGQSAQERKARLQEARQGWEKTANRALERAGQEARIDHRSHKERGLETLPQPKIGPQSWHQKNQENPRIQRVEDVKQHNQAVENIPAWNEQWAFHQAEGMKAEGELVTQVKADMAAALRERFDSADKAVTQKSERPAPSVEARSELAAFKEAAQAERMENQRKAQALTTATEKGQEYAGAVKTASDAQKALEMPQKGEIGLLKAQGRAARTGKAMEVAKGEFSEAVTAAVQDHGKQAVDAALRKALGPEYEAVRKAVKVVQSLSKTMSQYQGPEL